MDLSFKVGDIVVLKSGGPKMTVTQIDTAMGVRTTWFAGSKMDQGWFPAETLVAVTDEQPKIKH